MSISCKENGKIAGLPDMPYSQVVIIPATPPKRQKIHAKTLSSLALPAKAGCEWIRFHRHIGAGRYPVKTTNPALRAGCFYVLGPGLRREDGPR
jgi:hypothetical protein